MDAIPEFRRDILVSVRSIYSSKILHGQKTVELRRKFPEVGATGVLVLIYSSSPVSAVVGCARIKHVLKLPVSRIWKEYGVATCISKHEFDAYFAGLKHGFAILFESVKSLKRQLEAVELDVTYSLSPLVTFATFTGTIASSAFPQSSTRFSGNIVRAGLNYHFTFPAPVVAKY
jgi:predicted transcriptional regulator